MNNPCKGNGHIPTTNTSIQQFQKNFLLCCYYFARKIVIQSLLFELRARNVNKQNSSSRLSRPAMFCEFSSWWLVQVVGFSVSKDLLLEKRSSWMTTKASKVSVVVCEDDAYLSTIWKAWLQLDSLVFNEVWWSFCGQSLGSFKSTQSFKSHAP